MFSKLAIPFLQEQPAALAGGGRGGQEHRETYAKNARKHERMGEWIDRIGWPKFFEMIGQEFTKYHIDDFKHAGETYTRTAQLRH